MAAIKTLRFGYENQSVNVMYGSICFVFWGPFKIHKCNPWAESRIFKFILAVHILTTRL